MSTDGGKVKRRYMGRKLLSREDFPSDVDSNVIGTGGQTVERQGLDRQVGSRIPCLFATFLMMRCRCDCSNRSMFVGGTLRMFYLFALSFLENEPSDPD